MPNQPTQAETGLRQLGQRLRQEFAKSHPTPEKSLETVRGAVREQWAREAAREAEPPERRPPGPDIER